MVSRRRWGAPPGGGRIHSLAGGHKGAGASKEEGKGDAASSGIARAAGGSAAEEVSESEGEEEDPEAEFSADSDDEESEEEDVSDLPSKLAGVDILEDDASQFEIVHEGTWAARIADKLEAKYAIKAKCGRAIFCWIDGDSYLADMAYEDAISPFQRMKAWAQKHRKASQRGPQTMVYNMLCNLRGSTCVAYAMLCKCVVQYMWCDLRGAIYVV